MTETWGPAATLERLRERARLTDRVRAFFQERGLLEVTTPILSAAATTDPNLDAYAAVAPDAESECSRRYLHTSPEFPMKRLLAAGSGPIWQIAPVFRAGERGAWHNPEFTLLEWYRPGWNMGQLVDEVAALIGAVAGERPVRRRSYAELFAPLSVDPHVDGEDVLLAAAHRHGVPVPEGLRGDALLDLLLSHCVAPELGRGVIDVVDSFPVSQAALARICPGTPPVAERFECFLDGMEIANGFQELTDAAEQRERFAREQAQRRLDARPVPPMDERLLAALEAGVPECAGVALGLDRLYMVALGARRIDEVLAFPAERA